MRARQLVIGASLGPEALKIATDAFDAAWADLAQNYAAKPFVQVDAARLALAQAVLSVASEDSRDVEVLKQAALQVLAGNFRVDMNLPRVVEPNHG